MGGWIPVEEQQEQLTKTNKKRKDKIRNTVGFRIMGLCIVITLLVTTVFQIFYIQSLFSYYYDNVSSTLLTEARYNADLYLSYLSDEDLNTVIAENKNQFYRNTTSQVQILNNSGLVLFDSIGTDQVGKTLKTDDVLGIQNNESRIYVGPVSYSDEQTLSVAVPLKNQTNQVGILRLTTSLSDVNSMIRGRISVALMFSVVAINFAILLSYLVSRSIIQSIRSLTGVARKLSDGQYEEQADETSPGEIGELAATMNRMSDNILKKETIKNEFISSVSHELRTPLTSIKGWAITLQSPGLTDDINQEGLKIIEKESERLGSMVEDLLDFSRFSQGRVDLKKTEFNLVEVARNIIAQFRPRTTDKKIDMVFNYSQDEILLVADEDRVKQLLLNIIDNAIKFTLEGGTVLVDISQVGEMISTSITDTGIGISPEEIGLVTEKFWKGSSSQSHTGLGLSLAEEIAQAHGGSLSIKSKEGVGTTVTILLPREQA